MRLIDADALDKRIYNDIPISFFGSVKRMAAIRTMVEEEPTVTPEPGWISVKDRLPDSSCRVVCVDRLHHFYAVQYSVKHKKFNANDTEDGDFYALDTVTHWMPLPEPPKEEP